MTLHFSDPFDQAVAERGPPAMFTINADGELRLHPDRTRDAWQRCAGEVGPRTPPCHCLLRDQGTGWVQYVLVTSPLLVADHPRADAWRFGTEAAALDALAALGTVPVAQEGWIPPGAVRQ